MKKAIAFFLSLLILCSVCVAFGEYTDAETILAVQTALHDAGIYKGNLSGIKGNATENAIRTYQQKNGLKVSGQIDDELLASLGLGGGAATSEKSASTESAQSSALSFSVITNKDYGKDLLVFQNEAITIYLDKVSFSETNTFGDNMMIVSLYCDVNEVYFPKTSGYAASGNLTVLKVGGVSTKTAYHLSDSLMDYYGMSRSLQYPFQNPDKKSVDIEIELKSNRNNPKKFSYKIGPIHIDIAGDLYDGAGSQYAEHTAASVSLGGLMRGEPVTLIDTNGFTMKATAIRCQNMYSGEENGPKEILLYMSASNANTHDIALYTPYESTVLNGKKYDGLMTKASGSIPDTTIRIPALSEDMSILMHIQSYENPVPPLDELEYGEFTFTAYMATTDDLASQAYYRWPELFVYEPLSFDMAYDGAPVPDPISLPFPSLTNMIGKDVFSYEGVTLKCRDFFFYPSAGNNILVNAECTLMNDTDNDLRITFEEVLVNNQSSSAALSMKDTGGNRIYFCPAHSSCDASFSLRLPNEIMPESVTNLSCILHYLNNETQKNTLWQPVKFTIGDESAAPTADSSSAEEAIILPYTEDFFSIEDLPLISFSNVALDYDFVSVSDGLIFIAGKVTNDTDSDLKISLRSTTVNNNKFYGMIDLTEDNLEAFIPLDYVPAHGIAAYDIAIDISEGTANASVLTVTCTFCCTDVNTQATVIEEPITIIFQ